MTTRVLVAMIACCGLGASLFACDGPTPHSSTTNSSANSQSSGGSSEVIDGPTSCAAGEVLVIVRASGGTPGAANHRTRAECMSEANYQQSYGRSTECRREGARAECEAHYPSAAPP